MLSLGQYEYAGEIYTRLYITLSRRASQLRIGLTQQLRISNSRLRENQVLLPGKLN